MYAVIETDGKQYRVTPGDTIRVDRVDGAVGSEVEFDKVLAVFKEPGQMLSGPEASHARVKATIMGHDRTAKILVFKFKRKKQVRRTIGHRQSYTSLKVSEISA
jgi:large subunit ribosomal protein L21